MRFSHAQQKLGTVALLLLWCVALVTYRHYHSDGEVQRSSLGLLWNLFLASIPLLWSAGFEAASRRRNPFLAAVCFALWLLFLPNAPYILTDLIHLGPSPHIPMWLMLAILLSCAGTGTMLGYISLLSVHSEIEQTFGAAIGWGVATGSLLLCGFGIYLGRFLRWNSWDALTRPVHLLQSIAQQFIDPGVNPHPLAVTMVYGVGLIIGYLALRAVAVTMRPEKVTIE